MSVAQRRSGFFTFVLEKKDVSEAVVFFEVDQTLFICLENARKVFDFELLDGAGLDGSRHVAFGSDFDGGVKTVIDAAGWPLITGALLDANLSELKVRQLIGENALRFFEENLPANATAGH